MYELAGQDTGAGTRRWKVKALSAFPGLFAWFIIRFVPVFIPQRHFPGNETTAAGSVRP